MIGLTSCCGEKQMAEPLLQEPNLARRDRFVGAVANAVLRLASPRYRDLIAGSVQYGMRSAARDATTGASPPEPWQVLAGARPVTELDCKCELRPNEYKGRDGEWHCFNCDGRVLEL